MLDKIKGWTFLNESGGQWFVFTGIMLLILAAWAIIIGYMKKA